MKPNRVLGKGLSALIPAADATAGGRLGDREARMLALAEIGLNPHQPRKSFDINNLEELASSLTQVGVLQPVLVRRLRSGENALPLPGDALAAGAMPSDSGPSYCVVAGERRVRAARLAGLREVPAILCSYEDTEALRVALLENIQREDLNPMDEAGAYRDLLAAYGATQEELSGMLGKNRSSVANVLRLLALEPDIQAWLRDGTISRGHAKALLSVPEGPQRLRLARLCRSRGLSVRECERRAQALSTRSVGAGRRRRRGSPGDETPEVRALRERAEQRLGAPVALSRDARTGHGTVTVRFFSDDDLVRVLDAMGVDTNLG